MSIERAESVARISKHKPLFAWLCTNVARNQPHSLMPPSPALTARHQHCFTTAIVTREFYCTPIKRFAAWFVLCPPYMCAEYAHAKQRTTCSHSTVAARGLVSFRTNEFCWCCVSAPGLLDCYCPFCRARPKYAVGSGGVVHTMSLPFGGLRCCYNSVFLANCPSVNKHQKRH